MAEKLSLVAWFGCRAVGAGLGLMLAPALVHAVTPTATAQTAATPTAEAYVARVGGGAQVTAPGQLRLDGMRVVCGQRPTVLDPGLDDHSASYPGFLVLNPRRVATVATPVKLWIHAQACGYQFRGPDGLKADCFAIERGRQQGWLDDAGLAAVCSFISPARGSAEHPPGPERCTAMRNCYAAVKAAPTSSSSKADQ